MLRERAVRKWLCEDCGDGGGDDGGGDSGDFGCDHGGGDGGDDGDGSDVEVCFCDYIRVRMVTHKFVIMLFGVSGCRVGVGGWR